ncbi:hypothetical protein Hdeb2414_s0827g00951501 [Helianthus debilis subsp. tardiflorus]
MPQKERNSHNQSSSRTQNTKPKGYNFLCIISKPKYTTKFEFSIYSLSSNFAFWTRSITKSLGLFYLPLSSFLG